MAGTILKKWLARFGIHALDEGCDCERHVKEMDDNGPEWCWANQDKIVAWMRMEANRRRLPFPKTVAKIIVRQSILKARRDLAKQEQAHH